VESNAYEVFEKTCGFDELVALVVQQSELYTEQKGIPFQTDTQEIRAFSDVLPCVSKSERLLVF
jgi:hypothetical protein